MSEEERITEIRYRLNGFLPSTIQVTDLIVSVFDHRIYRHGRLSEQYRSATIGVQFVIVGEDPYKNVPIDLVAGYRSGQYSFGIIDLYSDSELLQNFRIARRELENYSGK